MDFTKAGVVILAIIGSSLVLRYRQTDDALLQADSFGEAVGKVALFAFPAVLFYIALAHRLATAMAQGVVLCGLLSAQWWSSATDRHSTASAGPGLVGWLLIPSLFGLWWVVPRLAREWNTGLVSTPAKVALLLPPTLLLYLIGPLALIAAAPVWWVALRPRGHVKRSTKTLEMPILPEQIRHYALVPRRGKKHYERADGGTSRHIVGGLARHPWAMFLGTVIAGFVVAGMIWLVVIYRERSDVGRCPFQSGMSTRSVAVGGWANPDECQYVDSLTGEPKYPDGGYLAGPVDTTPFSAAVAVGGTAAVVLAGTSTLAVRRISYRK